MADSSPSPQTASAPKIEDQALLTTVRSRGSAHEVVFGRFRLQRELGVGGMAVVWLAQDERLGLEVALKFLPGHVANDPEALHDLRREITRGLRLTHPGIVRLYDLHEDSSQGLAAIAMEYINGSTLADEKMRQPSHCFDVGEPLLPWVQTMCEVLSYVHEEARIVHRDLKPRNLMLTQIGRLKVADFGIAASLTDSQSRVTHHPGSSGTPAYMSPQQALGRNPAMADDIYAVGATIYELLTSKPPFFRGGLSLILNQVAMETPPSMAQRRVELNVTGMAAIPPAWEEIVAACLAKEPGERPATVREVWERLSGEVSQTRGATVSEPRPAPETPRSRAPLKREGSRRGALLGALIASVLLFLGLGAWWWSHPPRRAGQESIPSSASAPAAQTLSRYRNPETVLAQLQDLKLEKTGARAETLLAAAQLAAAPAKPSPRLAQFWPQLLETVEALSREETFLNPPKGTGDHWRLISGLGSVLQLTAIPAGDRAKLLPPLQQISATIARPLRINYISRILPGVQGLAPEIAETLRGRAIESAADKSDFSTLGYLLKELRDPGVTFKRLMARAPAIADGKLRLEFLQAIPEAVYLPSPADTTRYFAALLETAQGNGNDEETYFNHFAQQAVTAGEPDLAAKLADLQRGSLKGSADLAKYRPQAAFIPVRRAGYAGDLEGALAALRKVPAEVTFDEQVEPLLQLAIRQRDLVAAWEILLRCKSGPEWLHNLAQQLLAAGEIAPAENMLQQIEGTLDQERLAETLGKLAGAYLELGETDAARRVTARIPAGIWERSQGGYGFSANLRLVVLARLARQPELNTEWQADFAKLGERLQQGERGDEFAGLYLAAVWMGWDDKRESLEKLYDDHPSSFPSKYTELSIVQGLRIAQKTALEEKWRQRLDPAKPPFTWGPLARILFRERREAQLAEIEAAVPAEARPAFWNTLALALAEELNRARHAGEWKLIPARAGSRSGPPWDTSSREPIPPAEAWKRALAAAAQISPAETSAKFRREAIASAARAREIEVVLGLLDQVEREVGAQKADEACLEAAQAFRQERKDADVKRLADRLKRPESRFRFLIATVDDEKNRLLSDECLTILRDAEALIPSLTNYVEIDGRASAVNSAFEANAYVAALTSKTASDATLAGTRYEKARALLKEVAEGDRSWARLRMAYFYGMGGWFERAREQIKDAAEGTAFIPAFVARTWNEVASFQFAKGDRAGAEESLRMGKAHLRELARQQPNPDSILGGISYFLSDPSEETFARWTKTLKGEKVKVELMPLAEARKKCFAYVMLENRMLATSLRDEDTLTYPGADRVFLEAFRSLARYGTLEEAALAAERVRIGDDQKEMRERAEWARAEAVRLAGQRFRQDQRTNEGPAWVARFRDPLLQAMAWMGLAEGLSKVP